MPSRLLVNLLMKADLFSVLSFLTSFFWGLEWEEWSLLSEFTFIPSSISYTNLKTWIILVLLA